MKYVSIDIETTGIDHKNCQIIEFAAVVDDLKNQKPLEELPKFHSYVKHKLYTGEPYALAMHAEIFKKLSKQENACLPEELLPNFFEFLIKKAEYKVPVEINVAGKNFANFDKRFLELLPNKDIVKFKHRTIDPSILYLDVENDFELPGTSECLSRAGLDNTVKHTALEDALAVVNLLRCKFKK